MCTSTGRTFLDTPGHHAPNADVRLIDFLARQPRLKTQRVRRTSGAFERLKARDEIKDIGNALAFEHSLIFAKKTKEARKAQE